MCKILDDETVCHVFNRKSKQHLTADASQSALFIGYCGTCVPQRV